MAPSATSMIENLYTMALLYTAVLLHVLSLVPRTIQDERRSTSARPLATFQSNCGQVNDDRKINARTAILTTDSQNPSPAPISQTNSDNTIKVDATAKIQESTPAEITPAIVLPSSSKIKSTNCVKRSDIEATHKFPRDKYDTTSALPVNEDEELNLCDSTKAFDVEKTIVAGGVFACDLPEDTPALPMDDEEN
ncbi:hypothetical protein AeMF1_013266 [Aphanomyces euteiches]|nr:hypothetical protein AeMF1_013266 [Aphanomyces euteiches]KAH9182776.1 hypothetical protein AeNC1_015248 [Aphanomyces euteiches]